MPRLIKKGSTNITDYVFIVDSADGSPETGITITTLDLQYVRNGALPAAKVDATALVGAGDAHADNKMIEVDATDQPGLYRVDWPDAAFATGVSQVICTVKGTGFQPAHKEYQLVDFDPDDVVRLGLTALPNAAAEAAGGLYTRGSGAGQINQQTNGQIDSNLARWLNVAPLALTSQKVAVQILAAGDFVQAAADKVWSSATRTLTAFSTALALSVWNVLESAIVTASSIGLKVKNNLDAAVSSRSSHGDPDPSGFIDVAISSRATPAQVGTEVDNALDDAIILRRATAQAGAAGTITLDASAPATDDLYNELWVAIVSGTGAGQARVITDYVGSTKVATIAPNWTVNPDATSVFRIIAAARNDAITAGASDWSATEKENIRYRLGITGTQTAPGNTPTLPVRLDAQGKIDVKAEVDAGLDQAIPELPVGLPPATPSMRQAQMLPYMAYRDGTKSELSPGEHFIFNNAGVVIAKQTLTKTPTDFTRGKLTSG